MRKRLRVGLVQVYTGNGKGKTTAALGLALRAIGWGLKVYIIQFIKGGFNYGELYAIDKLPNVTLKAFGTGEYIRSPSEEDISLAKEAFKLAEKVVKSGEYDIVILDEVNVAMSLGLVDVNDVLNLIKDKPEHVELVLTGRYASQAVIEIADLVTEMKEVKHPFRRGVIAREGIEY